MMETLDESVGRLLDHLDAKKLAENTLVIFTSDNGGLHVLEFPGTPATYNGPYRAGKGFLYEGGLRIPLIVRYPGVTQPGRLIDTPVISHDWLPTLLEVANVKTPDRFDGVSILPLLKGAAAAPLQNRKFYWHFPHYTNQGGRPGGVIHSGAWKLIERYENGGFELYNLQDDPSEMKDVAAANTELVHRMATELAAWRKDAGAQMMAENPNFDARKQHALYEEFDASRVRVREGQKAVDLEKTMLDWRRGMNEAVRKKGQP